MKIKLATMELPDSTGIARAVNQLIVARMEEAAVILRREVLLEIRQRSPVASGRMLKGWQVAVFVRPKRLEWNVRIRNPSAFRRDVSYWRLVAFAPWSKHRGWLVDAVMSAARRWRVLLRGRWSARQLREMGG